jgi:hypothetical protein
MGQQYRVVNVGNINIQVAVCLLGPGAKNSNDEQEGESKLLQRFHFINVHHLNDMFANCAMAPYFNNGFFYLCRNG